jgi:hypothetical protein
MDCLTVSWYAAVTVSSLTVTFRLYHKMRTEIDPDQKHDVSERQKRG